MAILCLWRSRSLDPERPLEHLRYEVPRRENLHSLNPFQFQEMLIARDNVISMAFEGSSNNGIVVHICHDIAFCGDTGDKDGAMSQVVEKVINTFGDLGIFARNVRTLDHIRIFGQQGGGGDKIDPLSQSCIYDAC